jgi:hypothetical protein
MINRSYQNLPMLHSCQNKKVGKCEKEFFFTSKSAFGTSKQCAAVRTNFS